MTSEEYNKLLDAMQNTACEMIIAELENIRAEINNFIDELIKNEIKKFKE